MRPRSVICQLGAIPAGLAGFAGLYAFVVERSRVRLDRYTLDLDKDGLPEGGVTVLHISDLHLKGGGRIQERKIRSLKRLIGGLQYDVVALTGDLIHDASGFPQALSIVGELHPALAGFSCPGNHDYSEYSVWGVFDHTWQRSGSSTMPGWGDLWAVLGKLIDFAKKVFRNELVRLPVAFNDMAAMNADLLSLGIQPLVNAASRIESGGGNLWVAGVDDLTEGNPDLGAALKDVPEGAVLLLLAHNPDAWLDPAASRADLILAGHTHGGQIRLPMLGAVHTQGTHLTRRAPAGWFQRGTTHLFVSRGVGESIPLRFGVPPQVALIHLRGKRD